MALLATLHILFYKKSKANNRAINGFLEPSNSNDSPANKSSEICQYEGDKLEELSVFDEIGDLFGASLSSQDMMRLLTSKVNDIFPYKDCMFALQNPGAGELKIVYADSDEIADNVRKRVDILTNGQILVDGKSLKTSLAAPLIDAGETFGYLLLTPVEGESFGLQEKTLIAATANRMSPLLQATLNRERNAVNALTDPVTLTPNLEAFYLILEQKIAESQRFREEGLFTLLSIDIKGFAGLNSKYGYATGDNVLRHTAEIVKSRLRGMDFMARSTADEFILVLPSVTGNSLDKVIERLEHAFAKTPYQTESGAAIPIELNFGSAAYPENGETSGELMRVALFSKTTSKAKGVLPNSVVPFRAPANI